MVICGRTADVTSEIAIPDLFFGHKRIFGSTMGTQADLEQLVDLVAENRFQPEIDDTYPLAATGDAFAAMQNREAIGTIVVQN